MNKMTSIFLKLLLATSLLFAAQATFAGPFAIFGWHTTVKAIKFTPPVFTPYSTNISGPTYWSCEASRQATITNLTSQGYFITSAPHCTPRIIWIPVPIFWEEIKWPWPGPECLSCPLLTKENIAVIYPDHVKRVTELVRNYGIDVYNEELLQLQTKFDLEGFQEEMYQLELEQELEAGKGAYAR